MAFGLTVTCQSRQTEFNPDFVEILGRLKLNGQAITSYRKSGDKIEVNNKLWTCEDLLGVAEFVHEEGNSVKLNETFSIVQLDDGETTTVGDLVRTGRLKINGKVEDCSNFVKTTTFIQIKYKYLYITYLVTYV